MITLLRLFVVGGVLVLCVPTGASAQSCAAGPATLQILGSAGPAFNSSVLGWCDVIEEPKYRQKFLQPCVGVWHEPSPGSLHPCSLVWINAR